MVGGRPGGFNPPRQKVVVLPGRGLERMRRPSPQPVYPFAGRNVAWAPPAYANGHVFARSEQELVCASLAAGR